MEKKVIGIIGGMGPLATVDLFQKIILHTKALQDQDHLRVLIDNNIHIPDRTAAILQGGDSPVPQLTASARGLESMGADVLVMPCNTAHCFYDEVQHSVGVPVLNMIALTCQALSRSCVTKAGLLATDGTLRTGIYQRYCADGGIQLLEPEGSNQQAVMDLVYHGVKAGRLDYDMAPFCVAMDELLARGAQTLILGCTELPLVMHLCRGEYPTLDPTLELARGAILAAGGQYIE